MSASNSLKTGIVAVCLTMVFHSFAQYRVSDGGAVLAPMPGGGVVVLSTSDRYLTAARTYDSLGRSVSIPIGNSSRTGDVGDYVFTGSQLHYMPGYWQDYDLTEDLGISGYAIKRDSAFRTFYNPYTSSAT